ncbi:sulfate ABC transporter permease subunit CysT [Novosphingobium sp. P6W]|uniref:sulfate ABC transporter permease subunit CysT n=1 Tax=Novosphingobium sp. P6W TaxID=1609758 RepID=UPI0005C313C8|nr:sulfate ABC transporter permease subunit CysT [Novosphingobium sp. P6W]AXB78372.1 sulfate ABC transporter permease subunit CysT [Novosphingobium sp. P6W]KIS32321.1 sulfate transporter [Novosphingobium sp. P6W]
MTASPAAGTRRRWRQPSVLPGFGLTFGLSLGWLTLIVLIPLATIFLKSAGMGWDQFVAVGLSDRALAAYRLSFGTAAAAGLVNAVFGLLVAWVLVRYTFPGQRIIGAIVDLPFALPTAVAGIALTALYSPNGWVGRFLDPLGIKVAFTPIGITVALVFIGLPFVVRSVEPVLADLGKDVEEAAATLGATRLQTFRRVIFPAIAPALLTGFALAFARGVGEYGSVIFISGNMPGRTEIAPLLIVTQLEQYNYDGATAIATVMMLVSFAILLALNVVQAAGRRRYGA